MKNALLEGLGGPIGRYARGRGIWFNPTLWAVVVATVLFAALTLRQIPCLQTQADNPVDAFVRLCYSDIPLAWTSGGFGLGALPFGSDPMVYPPVLGLVLLWSIMLTRMFGAPVSAGLNLQEQLDGARIFFATSAVLLYLGFLVLVLCMTFLGHDSQRARYRSWDGMWLAASPVVLASGLISWQLFAVALAALGMVRLSKGRVPEAGIILGLACGADIMAAAVVLAVALVLGLRSSTRQVLWFAAATLTSIVVIHIPLLVHNWRAVAGFYQQEFTKDTGYGSVYFLGQFFGQQWREAGAFGLMMAALSLAVIASWVYLSKLRPRMGSMVVVFVFVAAFWSAEYPPQTALWLLFALLLARPRRWLLVAFTLTQVIYWAAIWGYLSGHLTASKNGNPGLYALALLARLGVEVVAVVSCLRDAAKESRPRG